MKKAVLFALIALLGGLALGTLFGSGISSASLNSVRATAAEYPAVSALDAIEVEGRSTLYQAAPADAGTSCLSDRAGQVLAALKESDYEALAALVHPEKGVTLTPYSTVEPVVTAISSPPSSSSCPRTTSLMCGVLRTAPAPPLN